MRTVEVETINYPNLLIAREKNLQFLGEHKNAFDLEYLYPLDLFDNLVAQVEPCRIECSCKIEEDKLDSARFNLAIDDLLHIRMDLMHGANYNVPAQFQYPAYGYLKMSAMRLF